MSGRKISSESFSSVGSDFLESPEDGLGDCPFSRVFWNGRSPSGSGSGPCPPEEAACWAAPGRAPRRRRVNLDSLGDSIRKLTSPTPQTIQWTLQRTLQYYEHEVIRYKDVKKDCPVGSNRCSYAELSDNDEVEDISGFLQCTANVLGLKLEELQEKFGEEFFNVCFEENERVLRAVGSTLQDFFNGFDALLEHIRTSCGQQATFESPSFLCRDLSDGTFMLHYFHPNRIVGFAMPGMIKVAARKIYQLQVKVEQVSNVCDKLCSEDSNQCNCKSLNFLIKVSENVNITKTPPLRSSHSPSDLRISISTFCRAFPFHLMFDPNMLILQLGEGLRKQMKCEPHKIFKFQDCFEIVSPKTTCTYQSVLLRLSTPFVIRTRPDTSGLEDQDKSVFENKDLKCQFF
uniref:guanylate cyclase n=1 Tax=Latimeria chalumnae TaxID=7897 RepID=H3AYB6_LATCH